MPKPLDVIVFGATSFVGQILVKHLWSRHGVAGEIRWGLAGRIVWAWVITIPASAAVAALSLVLLRFVGA